jgi:hypothetical protein
MPQAVDDVADRAADHQRQRQRTAPVPARVRASHRCHQTADTEGEPGEEPALPAPASARKLKAAPVLWCGTSSRKPSITGMRSPYSGSCASVPGLVHWSSTTPAARHPAQGRTRSASAATPHQNQSGSARPARHIGHAAAAQLRMRGMRADIARGGASSARTWRLSASATFARPNRRSRPSSAGAASSARARRRGDQQEAQLVASRARRAMDVASRIQIDLGLERPPISPAARIGSSSLMRPRAAPRRAVKSDHRPVAGVGRQRANPRTTRREQHDSGARARHHAPRSPRR